jgi:hypothetical protein
VKTPPYFGSVAALVTWAGAALVAPEVGRAVVVAVGTTEVADGAHDINNSTMLATDPSRDAFLFFMSSPSLF